MRAHPGKHWLGVLCGLLTVVLAVACGGVDSGGTGAVAVGPISGLGSVIVNGVRFDETNAAIRDDDDALLPSGRLQLGVMVRVAGSSPSGTAGSQRSTASTIRVSSQLLGTVSAIDAAGGSFVVLEQTILVTPATVFDSTYSAGLASLQVGSVVEVYARYDAARARYTATRIEARPAAAHFKLRGPISAVDRARRTLNIGNLTIDYSGVAPADEANAVVGMIVRAELQPLSQPGPALATALRSGVTPLPEREAATIEGRISALTSSAAFSVDGTPVDAQLASFPNGSAGLVLGARVSVEGLTFGGTLLARTVTFEGDESSGNSRFEIHGAIATIDTASKTLTVRGLVVDYSGPVQYEQGAEADLAVGRNIEVTGTLSTDGTRIRALEIEFE